MFGTHNILNFACCWCRAVVGLLVGRFFLPTFSCWQAGLLSPAPFIQRQRNQPFIHSFLGEVKALVTAGKKSLGSQVQTGMTNSGMPKPEMSLVLPLFIIPSLHVTGSYFYPGLPRERNPGMILMLWKGTRKGLRNSKWNFAVMRKEGFLCSLWWFKVLWTKSCSGSLQGHLFIILYSRSWGTVDQFFLPFSEWAHIYYEKWFSLRVICCLLLQVKSRREARARPIYILEPRFFSLFRDTGGINPFPRVVCGSFMSPVLVHVVMLALYAV